MENASNKSGNRYVNALKQNALTIKNMLDELQAWSAKQQKRNDSLLALISKLEESTVAVPRKPTSVWVEPTRLKPENIPKFVPISERPCGPNGVSTRFVSFVNFKGGVGKTTISSNLTAALASGNYNSGSKRKLRVLVVDLDFQGTLSSRCVDVGVYQGKIEGSQTTSQLLEQPNEVNVRFDDLLAPFIHVQTARVITADEKLDDKDEEAFLKLATNKIESRFLHRLWFHNDVVLNRFDLVIFDCPPRLTASSVGAFAASDFIFIPTCPEMFDVQATGRTISWLEVLKERLELSLQIGGVVVNRTQQKSGLTPVESSKINMIKNIFKDMLSQCSPEELQKQEKYLRTLDTFIPKKVGADHINGNTGEPLQGETLDCFKDLATEIFERIY